MNEVQFKKKIKEIRSQTSQKKVLMSLGKRFACEVTNTRISFFWRTSQNGVIRKVFLGTYETGENDISFKQAFELFKKYDAKVTDYKVRVQIGIVLDIYLDFVRKNRSNGRFMNIKTSVKYLQGLCPLYIDELDIPQVLNFLNTNIENENNRYTCLQTLRLAIDYAMLCYSCIKYNPLKGLQKNPLNSIRRPKYGGYKSLDPSRIKEVLYDKLDSIEMRYALFFLFLSMTALRLSSGLNLRWSYVDFEKKVINIPKEDMKMKVAFDLPITDYLDALLKTIKQEFPAPKDLVFYMENNKDHFLTKTTVSSNLKTITNSVISAHSFRKILATFLTSNKVPVSITRMCIAHKVATVLDATYDKYDFIQEKREAFNLWHEYVATQLSDKFRTFLVSK